MYIPRYPTLWPKYFFIGKRDNHPFPFKKEKLRFYNRGLSAIFHGLKILGLTHGDKVLLPSYICSDVIIPFLDLGLIIDFYDLNDDLSFNKQDLEKRIKNGAKALFFIHYFGFPQDIKYLESLRENYKLYLIEDCAHAFLSECNGIPVGDTGDISVFSLRKSIPIHSLGLLAMNKITYTGLSIELKGYQSPLKGISNRVIENIKLRSRITFPAKNIEQLKQINVYNRTDNLKKYSFPDIIAPSRITMRLLCNFDYKSIKYIRRLNFDILLNGIKDSNFINPLFTDLPEGVCPMVFPVILEQRDEVRKLMNIDGIDAYPWPFLPRTLNNNYHFAHYFAKNILLLPLHQDLSNRHLEAILKSLKKAVEKSSKSKNV